MRPLLAIALLTWKSGFRFKLFWVVLLLLLGAVVGLPLLVKDDGTARGFTQIVLTYSLGATTVLLGFCTLWLACGTMARDIEECQMQMIAVKPISRWQIWLGKWAGILMLDAALLAVAGGAVFALLLWRAQRLPPEQQRVLRSEIFVARGSLKEPPPDLDAAVNAEMEQRAKTTQLSPEEYELARNQILEQFKAGVQLVPPGYVRPWAFNVGGLKGALKNQPLFIRFKFHAAQPNASGTYLGLWQAGVPQQSVVWREVNKYAPDTFHELTLQPGSITREGRLIVAFANQDESALLFPIEDGFEILYREGTFGLNYVRGLLIIFFWMALLAALGLAAASFLSFPVAAFLAGTLMFVALSSSVLSTSVAEGTVIGMGHEGQAVATTWLDAMLLVFFRGMLSVLKLAQGFAPVDSLSTGRSIPWLEVARAFGQVVVLLGGALMAVGIALFTRRELARASIQ